MLYVFAGFPGNGSGPGQKHIYSGGLVHLIQDVEQLGILEFTRDPAVQYRKEGMFIGEERVGDVEVHMSELCLRDGIDWDWFPAGWCFGNGVAISKTTALYETKTIIHESGLSLDELLTSGVVVDMSTVKLQRVHNRTEGWKQWEARWIPGTCPQESVTIILTSVMVVDRLPPFAYDRLRAVIENRAEPKDLHLYEDKHFTEIRRWDSEVSRRRLANALPSG
jgi:hypothetical protein